MDLPIYPTENEEKMDMEDHFLIEKKSRSTHGDFTMFVLQSFVWGEQHKCGFLNRKNGDLAIKHLDWTDTYSGCITKTKFIWH